MAAIKATTESRARTRRPPRSYKSITATRFTQQTSRAGAALVQCPAWPVTAPLG